MPRWFCRLNAYNYTCRWNLHTGECMTHQVMPNGGQSQWGGSSSSHYQTPGPTPRPAFQQAFPSPRACFPYDGPYQQGPYNQGHYQQGPYYQQGPHWNEERSSETFSELDDATTVAPEPIPEKWFLDADGNAIDAREWDENKMRENTAAREAILKTRRKVKAEAAAAAEAAEVAEKAKKLAEKEDREARRRFRAERAERAQAQQTPRQGRAEPANVRNWVHEQSGPHGGATWDPWSGRWYRNGRPGYY